MKENTRGIYRHFGLKDIGKIKESFEAFLFCTSGTPDIIHQGIYFSINIRRKCFFSYLSLISIRRGWCLQDCHVFKLFFYVSIIDQEEHSILKDKPGRKITLSRCWDLRINIYTKADFLSSKIVNIQYFFLTYVPYFTYFLQICIWWSISWSRLSFLD